MGLRIETRTVPLGQWDKDFRREQFCWANGTWTLDENSFVGLSYRLRIVYIPTKRTVPTAIPPPKKQNIHSSIRGRAYSCLQAFNRVKIKHAK